jgi:hypothetical protein
LRKSRPHFSYNDEEVKMKYPVVIHKSEYGYDVTAPSCPAVTARGIVSKKP